MQQIDQCVGSSVVGRECRGHRIAGCGQADRTKQIGEVGIERAGCIRHACRGHRIGKRDRRPLRQ